MTASKQFIVLLITFIFTVPIPADDHSDHHLHEADFAITLNDCNEIRIEPHVLGSELDVLFFFWTDEPGFDSQAGTFAIGSSVGFNILDALKKWTGKGFDALDPNTGETMTVSFLFGSSFATCQTGAGFVEGFEVPVSPDGSWHKHLGFTLNGAGSNDPNDDIYLLKLELFNSTNEPNNTYSNPFWIVFNLGMDEHEYHNAIHWVDEHLAHLPDLHQDGYVDFKDFSILASEWLNTECDCRNNWCNQTDITQDGRVDLADLTEFTSYWLVPKE